MRIDEPTFFCLDCHDEPSGWRIVQCPAKHCGSRTPRHPAHHYAIKCHCYQQNPVVARYNERHKQPEVAKVARRRRPMPAEREFSR